MKRTINAIVVTLVLLFSSSAYAQQASATHSHVASKQKIEKYAKRALNALAAKGKIEKSWENQKITNIKKVGKEWIVEFKNSSIKEKRKAKLSLYLTTYGKVKGANYSGS